ncbi:MAG: type 11 methyltransferase [Paenibacillaceae bacterium]|jgi:ubiquinone/menaquinone biosynthesis C-methylase UbiE|nr:type 11 methyltransferase [Paenibacillaceae bacterium]
MAEEEQNCARLEQLESPERFSLLPPERLLDLLEISEEDLVLDLGAGGGYFTFPAAQRTKGRVCAVDCDPAMLEILRERSIKKSTARLEILEGSAEHIPLEAESVDAAVASLILHILHNPGMGIAEISRVLKPGGRGLVVEWARPRADGKSGHRVLLQDMCRLLEKEGLKTAAVHDWAGTYYSVLFRKQQAPG